MKRFSTMLILPILALAALEAAAAQSVRIMADRVEVRSYSSPEAPVVGALAKGTVLEVVSREGDWIRIKIPESGYPGYVPVAFCQFVQGVAPTTPAPAPPQPMVPAITATPVREAPPVREAAPVPPPQQATDHADSQQRGGFWIGFGAGYGSAAASASCDGCSGDRQGSFTGFLKLGGTLSPQVLLGVESNAWVKSQDMGDGTNATLTLGAVSGTVTVYPVVTSGFFLKGGAGLSYMSTDVSLSGVSVNVSKAGWGVIGGLGYDLRVGRKISITPSFNYYYGKPGDISVGGDLVFPGWSQNVLDFALGITFH